MKIFVFVFAVLAIAVGLYLYFSNTVTQMSAIITNDQSTWPTGDKIWTICRAIALAEGANISGSVPDRLNNPGDISDGSSTYGSQVQDGSHVTTFPDKKTGWQALYNKINNIANGKSCVYCADWTWQQFAEKYAGDSCVWANNVASALGVSSDTTMASFINS